MTHRIGLASVLLVMGGSTVVAQQTVTGTFSGTVESIDDDLAGGNGPAVRVGDPFTGTFYYRACPDSVTAAGDGLAYGFGERELRMTVQIGPLVWAIDNSPFTGELVASASPTVERYSVAAMAADDDSYILRFPSIVSGDVELHVLRLTLADDQLPLGLLDGQHMPTTAADVDFSEATVASAEISSWDIINDYYWIVTLDVDQFTLNGPTHVSHYCSATPNSTGLPAHIGIDGTLGVSGDSTTLRAVDAPAGVFGLFFYGNSQIQVPFGDGFRCVGTTAGGTFRLQGPVQVDGSGTVSRPLDFTAPPAVAGPGQINPGATFNFQFWFRDPTGPGGTGFNLSNGVSVTFCP